MRITPFDLFHGDGCNDQDDGDEIVWPPEWARDIQADPVIAHINDLEALIDDCWNASDERFLGYTDEASAARAKKFQRELEDELDRYEIGTLERWMWIRI